MTSQACSVIMVSVEERNGRLRRKGTMTDMFEAVAWVDVTEEGEIVAVHPVADPCRANQTIVTLPDGQQVAIFGADLTGARVLHRNGPGSTWGAEIPRAHPADREGHRGSVHHGSW